MTCLVKQLDPLTAYVVVKLGRPVVEASQLLGPICIAVPGVMAGAFGATALKRLLLSVEGREHAWLLSLLPEVSLMVNLVLITQLWQPHLIAAVLILLLFEVLLAPVNDVSSPVALLPWLVAYRVLMARVVELCLVAELVAV